MNSVVVSSRFTDKHLSFDVNTRAELLFRAALLGTDKEVVVGFRLFRRKIVSESVWFDTRVSALEICTNYKKAQHRKDVDPRDWANKFVESLVSPEISAHTNGLHARALETLSAEHFGSEKIVLNFDPYSLDDDARVDAFINYRRNCFSVSIEMGIMLPFLKEKCLCNDDRAERYCLLCGGK